MTVKLLLGLHVPKRKLVTLTKTLGITTFIEHMTLPQAKENQSTARKEYYRIKHKSHLLRVTFREQLAQAIATSKNIQISSGLWELINREETREMHKIIK